MFDIYIFHFYSAKYPGRSIYLVDIDCIEKEKEKRVAEVQNGLEAPESEEQNSMYVHCKYTPAVY